MANELELYYSSFGGVDTRSNKLLQDPKTFRKGSKNFRYNFQDEIQNANGFQHKDATVSGYTTPTMVDIFEYKYRDVNDGSSRNEILGVATDGYLYRKKNHYLKWTNTATISSYSVNYNEVTDEFELSFETIFAPLTPITLSSTTTLNQLKNAINAYSPITVDIVDDNDVSVANSPLLAYCLDCIIKDSTFALNGVYYWEKVPFPDTNNPIPFTTSYFQYIPFPITKNNYSSSDYEGISSINLNNSIYISDGGFPIKYDGKHCYRAGIPKLRQWQYGPSKYFSLSALEYNEATAVTAAPLPDGAYYYKTRACQKDYNGLEVYGIIEDYGNKLQMNGGVNAGEIKNDGLYRGRDFPIYNCSINTSATLSVLVKGGSSNTSVTFSNGVYFLDKDYAFDVITFGTDVIIHANGYQIFYKTSYSGTPTIYNAVNAKTSTTYTINVTPTNTIGPNFYVGQSLVIYYYLLPPHPITSSLPPFMLDNYPFSVGTEYNRLWNKNFYAYYYAEITEVTQTTIKIKKPLDVPVADIPSGYKWAYSIVHKNVLNAAYVPTLEMNAFGEKDLTAAPYGMSYQIFRSKKNSLTSALDEGPYYCIGHSPVGEAAYITGPNKFNTARFFDNLPDTELNVLYDDLEPGDEIPRACKYFAQFQGQLVQAGRPLYKIIIDTIVGTTSSYYPSIGANATPDNQTLYTEANLCDFQSIYWADALAPEGFSLDGVHEITMDTKFSDKITGIAQNKDALFVFKTRSTGLVTGEIANNDVFLEILEADAGCISHRSIVDVRGSLIWLDGVNGFYSCVAGRLPVNIGYPIQDYTKINVGKLNFRKATAANNRKESLYMCAVGSTMFVFDYADKGMDQRNCWYIWDRTQANSMMYDTNDNLLFFDGTRTWRMKVTNTKYDFTDHKSAIPMVLNTAWFTQGYPTIDKHYVGFWINSVQGDFTLTVKQYGNFLDDQIASQGNVSFPIESSSKKAIKQQVKAALPKLSSISFGIENAEKNKWVRLQGYELQYSPDFAVGEPKK